MMDECQYCFSADVVPILDVRMQQNPIGGNPYRGYCRNCEKVQPVVSKESFKQHLYPHVAPNDRSDDITNETLIPLEEWDRRDEYQDVLERIRNRDEIEAAQDDDPDDEADDPDPDAGGGAVVESTGDVETDDAGDDAGGGDKTAVTDGGHPTGELDHDPDPDPTASDDVDADDEGDDGGAAEGPSNAFECPACGEVITGTPPECPVCGAPYDYS